MSEDFLTGLTERQRAAVLHMEGPMLVLAGPGSGKTRVISHRVAHLVSRGVPPGGILALTFTNKAAEEMRTRLRAMAVPRGATMCTFHSLCARLLREFAGRAGLPENFVIYDQSDQKSVLNEVMKERDLDPKEFPPVKVLREIGLIKNEMTAPDKAPGLAAPGLKEGLIGDIYAAYEKRLAAAGALDFDDLLVRTARLLGNDQELRDRLGRRYRFILVDEYQDTNACQYRIARDLARGHNNLFVTGDPDQSIYGWRGADIGNILAFEKDFPGAPVVRLEENFRSTPEVLRLADELIRANTRRKEKRLVARKPGGSPPRLYRFADEREEARGAAAWINGMHKDHGIDYGRTAIFYRTNAMSRVLEEALIQAAIPYQIVKGLEFFQRREVKDMLAYLRLLVNPADEASLLRVINRPARGIGDATVRKLLDHSRSSGRDIWSLLKDPGGVPDISAAVLLRLERFFGMIEELRNRLGQPVAGIARAVFARTGLKDALADEKNTDAMENVEEFIHSAMQFDGEETASDGLAGYLRQTALISDADSTREGSGAVSLMTLHTAKGLEFAAVMIIGVEDGIIPHCRSFEGGRDVEEERRLLFVGITRAERFLALSHTQARTVYGTSKPAALSPFLRGATGLEIVHAPFLNKGFEVREDRSSGREERVPVSQKAIWREEPRPAPPPADGGSPFRPGQRVRHPAIGTGRIEKITADGTKSRAVVQFDSGARLVMDLGQARLEPLD